MKMLHAQSHVAVGAQASVLSLRRELALVRSANLDEVEVLQEQLAGMRRGWEKEKISRVELEDLWDAARATSRNLELKYTELSHKAVDQSELVSQLSNQHHSLVNTLRTNIESAQVSKGSLKRRQAR